MVTKLPFPMGQRMHLVISALLLVCFTFQETNAQTKFKLAGKYRLEKLVLNYKQPDPNQENHLFVPQYKSGSPIEIKQDGSFTYIVGKETKTVVLSPINDHEVKLIFRSGYISKNDSENQQSESYSVFNYTFNKKQLVLTKDDPLLSESYTFTKIK